MGPGKQTQIISPEPKCPTEKSPYTEPVRHSSYIVEVGEEDYDKLCKALALENKASWPFMAHMQLVFLYT